MGSRIVSLLLVLLAAGGYLGYLIYTQKVPCVTPISYALATYDSRFSLSKSQAQTDIDAAATVWNEALGREVFVKSASPELPVYFVYGRVQQVVDTREAIGNNLDEVHAKARAMADEYDRLKAEFDAANTRGVATQEMADTLNALAKQYNDLVAQEHSLVSQSNRAIPQEEIDGGQYVSDQSGSRVYVYGFQNTTELKRALIHEFGHALGLEHVAGTESVMYPVNDSPNLTLTAQDVAELKRACNIE